MEQDIPFISRKPKIDFAKRRSLYKQYRLNGMCMFDAAVNAGYARTTALTRGKKLDKAMNIRETLERMGVTDDVLVGKLRAGLDCDKSIVCDKEVVSVPDFPTRHKYVETAMRLKGHMDGEGAVKGGTAPVVVFQIIQADSEGNEIDQRTDCPEVQVLENTDSVS